MGVGHGRKDDAVDDTEAVVSAVVTDAAELPTADDTDPASAAVVSPVDVEYPTAAVVE